MIRLPIFVVNALFWAVTAWIVLLLLGVVLSCFQTIDLFEWLKIVALASLLIGVINAGTELMFDYFRRESLVKRLRQQRNKPPL